MLLQVLVEDVLIGILQCTYEFIIMIKIKILL